MGVDSGPTSGGLTISRATVAKAALGFTAAGAAAYLAAQGGTERLDIQNSDLSFPGDLPPYYMTLFFEKYERPSIFDPPFVKPTGGIRLPIPNNLIDSQSVTYNTEPLGAGYGSALAQADKFLHGEKTASAGWSAAINAIKGGIVGAGAAAAGSAASVYTQTFGKALNPFLTVFFETPTFKEHTFTWKLTPTNIDESNTIKDIVKRFKTSMLPSVVTSSGGSLFSYPDIVDIALYPDDAWLYKFKKCVIKNMTVNYAPGNTPSFFKSQAPTEVQIILNLQEIEIWKQDDFTGRDLNSAIGINTIG
jgi:hypothetical protein